MGLGGGLEKIGDPTSQLGNKYTFFKGPCLHVDCRPFWVAKWLGSWLMETLNGEGNEEVARQKI